jgi:hypothetical protein
MYLPFAQCWAGEAAIQENLINPFIPTPDTVLRKRCIAKQMFL